MDTPCHKEGGCIRAFEDDTCGDQGQCSIVLAVMAERERCALFVKNWNENVRDGYLNGYLGERISKRIMSGS